MTFVTGFDLDLTLIDSRPSMTFALAALGEELNGVKLAYPPTGIRGTIEEHFARCYPDRDPAVVAERYRAIYREQATALARLLPGADEAIEAARELGGVVVITGKHPGNARLHLDQHGLRVDHLIGWRTGLEKAATLRDLRVTVYVGDQVEDMAAARAAGCIAVGVTSGLDPADALLAAGATVVVDALAQLPDLLRGFAASSSW